MLIIYCIGLFDGCFGSGVWQCWNCRVPFFLLGWRGTPEKGGIGPGSGCRRGCFCGFVGWMERDARGRWHRSGGGCRRGCFWGFERWMWLRDARGKWHRSGQGLRRGILLGLRETAKSIAAGPELACGSDSRPCRNNAVSRSPSSNHPSSAAARPDATFLWLTFPADRKKHAGYGSGLGVLS